MRVRVELTWINTLLALHIQCVDVILIEPCIDQCTSQLRTSNEVSINLMTFNRHVVYYSLPGERTTLLTYYSDESKRGRF